MFKPPLRECLNKGDFINLLVDWYQWMCITESLPIVNLTPVILKTVGSIYWRWEWKFCWDLSNVISGGNRLFRWDCLFIAETLYPSVNNRKILHLSTFIIKQFHDIFDKIPFRASTFSYENKVILAYRALNFFPFNAKQEMNLTFPHVLTF